MSENNFKVGDLIECHNNTWRFNAIIKELIPETNPVEYIVS
jgi:hypothetical protein